MSVSILYFGLDMHKDRVTLPVIAAALPNRGT
jgi:hypothetical protein